MSIISSFADSDLQKYLKKNGRFPGVTLQVKPISQKLLSLPLPITIKEFTEYSFSDSVLVPVSSFSFTFVNPTLKGSILDYIADGDIAMLSANDTIISTGLIDSISIDTDVSGEVVHVHGRSLLGQLEDQSTMNDRDKPIWGNKLTIDQVVSALTTNTRINKYRLQDTSPGQFLFATEPGESKLSALMRYLEPLNLIVWMDPDGTLVVGKPNMGILNVPAGLLVVDRENRKSNCLGMKAVYSSTQIPNVIIPIWSGQETTQNRVLPESVIYNNASGPKRLLKGDHRVPKTIVVSNPQGADAQSLSLANALSVGGANVLQAYAKRELARANVNELQVQANVQGHYNDDLSPMVIDTVYQVKYPRGGVDEDMYVHTVEYSLSRDQGQRTHLFLCKKGCIVADASISSTGLSSLVKSTSIV